MTEPDRQIDPASSPSRHNSWSIGLLGDDPGEIAQRDADLSAAGLTNVRLFVDAATIVPERCSHVPITVVNRQFSAAARERLIVAELLMRSPDKRAILLVNSAASTGGIGHWCGRVEKLLTDSASSKLVVDSLQSTGLIALSVDSGKAYLGDPEGLAAALHSDADDHEFAATLIEWASRASLPLVVETLAGERTKASEAADATEDRIRVSGAGVSIVVPTWNCGDYLPACLDSLLRQTVTAEVIVVDDASTDQTTAVLETYGDRITAIRHATQRGANAARNTGLEAAHGEMIAFADADNEYAARWIEALLRPLLADPAASLAYCGYTKQTPDGSRIENRGAPWNLDTLWFGNYIDMSSVVRRSALPAEGLHEGFRPFDDWRLWLGMAERGWHGNWVPEQLFVKHVRSASKTEQSMSDPNQRGRDIASVRRQFAGLVGLDKPVSVVIPACGCEDLTARCLSHLGDYCGVPFDVVYVDNGSPIETLDCVARAADRVGVAVRMIRNLENRGFTDAVNQGIAASGGRDVLLLNNDCFIGPGCVENLCRELRFDDRVAAAGPLTGDDGNQSLRKETRRALLRLPEDAMELLDDPVQMSFRLSQKLRSVPEPVLSFFCTLLSGEAIRRYGALDSRFSSGLAADDEWCFRVRNHGQEVRLVLNAYAAHLHRSSFERLEIDRDALQADAKELLHRVLADDDDNSNQ